MVASFIVFPTAYSTIVISLLCWWLFLSTPTDKFQEFLNRNAFAVPNSSRKLVVATFANEAYTPLVDLFFRRLSELRLENVIVFCIDEYIYEYCLLHHIPAWQLTNLPPRSLVSPTFWQNIFQNINHLRRRAYPAGNIEFISLTQLKYLVFYSVVSYNFDILFSDPDILWIQNPIHYFLSQRRTTHADIYIQTDRKQSYQSLFSSMNTGFVYIRSHCGSQLLLRIMMQQTFQQYPMVSQQRSFNRVLCRTGPCWYSKRVTTNICRTFLEPDDIFLSCIGANQRLRESHSIGAQIVTHILDPSLFPHGAFPLSLTDSKNDALPRNTRLIDISLQQQEHIFHPDRIIIHYNWIRGVDNKTEKISQALKYLKVFRIE